jgi:hypothetical protein
MAWTVSFHSSGLDASIVMVSDASVVIVVSEFVKRKREAFQIASRTDSLFSSKEDM